MKRRYLNKINATYRFKLQVLSLDVNQDVDDVTKVRLWRDYLKILASVGDISYHQANSWTYPKELK